MVGWMVFTSQTYTDNPSVQNPTMFLTVFWGVMVLFATAVLWLYLSAILFALGGLVLLVWLISGLLRELCWRVSTHVKGAWAAVWM